MPRLASKLLFESHSKRLRPHGGDTGVIKSGYAGVDIFFLISGFVITRLILRDIAGGTFSLPAFFARRVRRLLPVALLVYAVATVIGYFILLPDAFVGFGRSLTGASMGRYGAGGAVASGTRAIHPPADSASES